MRKIALFGMLVVASLGFVGCASLFGQDEGLKDEGLGEISDVKVEKNENGEPVYYVTIRYCRQETTTFVTRRTYDKMYIGKRLYLKLLAKDDPDRVTYTWWATDGALDRALLVEFQKP